MKLAILGAWLHDIGKFAQRAKESHSSLEHEFCPVWDGKHTHQHVLYTDYFIEEILPLPEELEASRSFLAGLASYHHKADGLSREHRAIQMADRLSAGMDRTESEKEGNYIAERMDSIFSKVRLNGMGLDDKNPIPKYKLLPLTEDKAIFPVKDAINGPDYGSLWRDFRLALQKLPLDLGTRAWKASLVSLLERYCWCIPSSTWKSLPDVSLYDHAATTAAITQAILACTEGQEKFLLFGGDLSGIQSFIFGKEEPADKGAVKLLRARSFLLQTITRSLWLALLDRLKLEPEARIMDAGGRFLLLLPGTPEIQKKIAEYEYDAEKWLFGQFQGSIRINFASLELGEDDFKKENFAACHEKFSDLLEEAKLRQFSRLFASGASPVVPVDYANYGKYGECEFCHTRPGVKIEDEKSTCAQCAQLKNLGGKLPKAAFLVFSKDKTGGIPLFDGIWLRLYEDFDRELKNESRHALQVLSIREEPVFTASPVAGHAPQITNRDLASWKAQDLLTENSGKTFFMDEECELNEPKTFSMLAHNARLAPAKEGEPWRSVPCLGICKADVDNLGLIFSLGLAKNFSLSCFAMLARMLNYFFAAYLMRLIREEFPDIYVVFAGGDDLFVIGPWPETIAFSLRMAEDFRKFCAGNPAVTISAGLPLVKAGLPMRAIREEAEKLLEESKKYDKDNPKNAISLFGVSAHWPQAAKLLSTGRWLEEICEKNIVSNSFLRRLLGYSRECGKFISGKKLAENGLFLSHLSYDLARNGEKMKKNAFLEEKEISSAQDFASFLGLPEDMKYFANLEMGISWALYRTRIS